MDSINKVLNAMNGGCSSMSWTTEDNKHSSFKIHHLYTNN